MLISSLVGVACDRSTALVPTVIFQGLASFCAIAQKEKPIVNSVINIYFFIMVD